MSPKVPPSIFVDICNIMVVKKSQRVPSVRFFTMRLLKNLSFLFFSEICFFLYDFSNSFSSPQNFTRNEMFCEHKGLLRVFGTMRLTGDLHQKGFRKKSKRFSLIFRFLKDFRLRKMIFLLFPVGKRLVFDSKKKFP